MNSLKNILMAAVVGVCLGAAVGHAQTPANVVIVSGNGQLICQTCAQPQGEFQTLVVQVTDANGKPVVGTTVNWTIASGGIGGQITTPTTITDSNGMTSAFFFPGFPQPGFGGANNAYEQTTILATAGTASAAFTVTQALTDQFGHSFISVLPNPNGVPALALTYDSQISGQVGTTSTLPLVVGVFANGQPVPNVAVNVWNLQTGPTVECATGANAGLDTVLTGADGTASCNLVFSGAPGQGQFYLLVGSLLDTDPTVQPLPYYSYQLIDTITAGQPGALRLISGGGQSAQAGQALAAPLVVEVDTATQLQPLAGQTVTWKVSPTGAGSLGSASSTTGTNGQATNTLTLNSAYSGQVQVTATVSGASSIAPVTFTITSLPNVTVTGLQIVSGNNQTAIVNTQFSAPLVVQLNASSGTGTGVTVQFAVSGPATLSSSAATTGSTGQASVTVQAGSTSGAVTVTATAAGYSQTFNLTVAPPGPTLTASGFQNGADFAAGSLSPCSIATLIASGIAPGLSNMISGEAYGLGPLPFTLGNDQVKVGSSSAPIFSVGLNGSNQQQLTFQVPCDVTPGSSVPVVVSVGPGSASINIPIQTASPGIFRTLMSDNVMRAVIERPDGSFVSLTNPARRGETVVAFATGLGTSIPAVGTDALPPPGVNAMPQDTVIAGIALAGGGATGVSLTAQLSPDLVGVWEVSFQIPANAATGNNVAFSIAVIPPGATSSIPSGTTSIPVQ